MYVYIYIYRFVTLCVYVCVLCICIYAFLYVHIHIYTVHIYIYIHVNMYAHVCMCIYIYVCAHVKTRLSTSATNMKGPCLLDLGLRRLERDADHLPPGRSPNLQDQGARNLGLEPGKELDSGEHQQLPKTFGRPSVGREKLAW